MEVVVAAAEQFRLPRYMALAAQLLGRADGAQLRRRRPGGGGPAARGEKGPADLQEEVE